MLRAGGVLTVVGGAGVAVLALVAGLEAALLPGGLVLGSGLALWLAGRQRGGAALTPAGRRRARRAVGLFAAGVLLAGLAAAVPRLAAARYLAYACALLATLLVGADFARGARGGGGAEGRAAGDPPQEGGPRP